MRKIVYIFVLFLMLLVLAFAGFTTACDAGQDGWNCCEPKYRGHGWAYASGFDPITGFVNEMSCCPDSDGDGVPGCPTFDFISQQFYNSPDCDDGDIHIKGSCINHHIMSVKVLSNDSRVHWSTRQQKNPEELSILDLINLEIFWENKYGLIPGLIKLYVGLLNQTTGSIDYGKYPLPVSLPGGNASSSIISFSFHDIESANEDMIRTVDELGYLPIRLMPHLVFDGEISNGSFFDYNLPLTNCYHVSGNGNKKIVTMRGVSSLLTGDEISGKAGTAHDGFSVLDPFKKYINEFSFYADLKNYEEEPTLSISITGESRALDMPASSCQNPFVTAFYRAGMLCDPPTNLPPCRPQFIENYALATNDGSGRIIFNVDRDGGVFSESAVFLHETGHAIAYLSDEIGPVKGNEENWLGRLINKARANCQKQYSDFIYGDILYATPRLGCSKTNRFYSPSIKSIMSESNPSGVFNVVSCGHIISAIKGGDPKSYWPECRGLDTADISCIFGTQIGCPIGFTCKEDSLCHPSG